MSFSVLICNRLSEQGCWVCGKRYMTKLLSTGHGPFQIDQACKHHLMSVIHAMLIWDRKKSLDSLWGSKFCLKSITFFFNGRFHSSPSKKPGFELMLYYKEMEKKGKTGHLKQPLAHRVQQSRESESWPLGIKNLNSLFVSEWSPNGGLNSFTLRNFIY